MKVEFEIATEWVEEAQRYLDLARSWSDCMFLLWLFSIVRLYQLGESQSGS